ncbi:hypothetical protein [Arthrobacter sp. D3-16]
MSDIAMIAVLVIASAWSILLFWRNIFEKTIAAALLVLIFGAGFAQTVIPVRFVLALAALTIIVTTTLKYRATLSRKVLRVVSITSTSCLVAYGALQMFVQPEMLDPLFRYTVLFPLMFVAGYVACNLNLGAVLSKLYVLTGLAMAALAVLERVQNSFFLAGNYENAGRLVRDGAIRSIVGAEHPLVLSVLLVAAIPLVQVTFTTLVLRTGAFVLLIAGIVSTNSRGALVLICMWFVITAALKSRIFGRVHTSLLQFFAAASIVVGLIWILTGSGSDSLSSTSAVDASAEYRSSLYLFAAQSLVEQPWGWGLSGLPVGVYVVASYFGSLDIAVTIDSEVALLMFDFGWLGVLGFIVMASFLLRAGRLRSPLGQAALLLSASGFYLALHSWSGLGSAWFLLLGLSVSYGITKPKSVQVEDDNHSTNGVVAKSVMDG